MNKRNQFSGNISHDNLLKLDGWKLSDPEYRSILDYIEPKCYIEASSSGQWGTVEKVIRNKNGIPVCVKARYSDNHGKNNLVDYISVDRIDFFEPYSRYVSDLGQYNNYNYNYDYDYNCNDEEGEI
jgi:hypothetical protein